MCVYMCVYIYIYNNIIIIVTIIISIIVDIITTTTTIIIIIIIIIIKPVNNHDAVGRLGPWGAGGRLAGGRRLSEGVASFATSSEAEISLERHLKHMETKQQHTTDSYFNYKRRNIMQDTLTLFLRYSKDKHRDILKIFKT